MVAYFGVSEKIGERPFEKEGIALSSGSEFLEC